MRFAMFSKSLQSMSVPEAGKTVKALGFDGIELTVRPNGHIQPEHVREDLAYLRGQAHSDEGTPQTSRAEPVLA